MYFGDDLTDLPRDVEIDGATSDDIQADDDDLAIKETDIFKSEDANKTLENGEHIEDKDAPLQCPRCLASFELDGDLQKHVNKCMD